MNQLNLSKWLKFITIAVGVMGAVVFFIIIPEIGRELAAPLEFSNRYWPWLIFIWIMAVPCYMVLGFFWSICNQIKKNESFTEVNVRNLIWISRLAIFDSILCFLGNVLLAVLNMSHPGILVGFLFVIFIGVAIAIVSSALSHLVKKASMIQEENDLTI